jgi:hypothetical protein
MMIIGVDYHPSFQTIAFLMEETGECGEQELNHSDGQAERFYRDLQQRGIRVRVRSITIRTLKIFSYFFPSRCSLVSEGSSRRICPRELGGTRISGVNR